MKRRGFIGAGAAAALLASGCDFSLRDGLLNACRAELPPSLRDHALVQAAWKGLEPAQVWDSHCHVFGNGDSGSGLWFNPRLENIWQPLGYVQRELYVNAGCVDLSPGRADKSYVERMLRQCQAMPAGFHVLLFGFDWARDDAGAPMQDRSTFHVPDDYVAGLAASHPERFEWAASIHPYDPRALDRLDAAVARGASAIKWLPSSQNIDPAAPRCDPFYAKLAALRLPLIAHAGDERAVHGFGEHLGNPLRLRRPLDAGVRVVVAHCASLGEAKDTDHGGTATVTNFELFARLMDEPRYRSNLFGDLAAVTQSNRMGVLPTLLARRDWHDRLLNGSDYPLPGVVPLISIPALADRHLLAPAAVEPLRSLREANVLLFAFVLQRSLALNGQGFAPTAFETARFFRREAAAPADMHTSRNSLAWPGIYEGVLPCADCPGIKTRLTLKQGGSFELSTQYLDRQPAASIVRGAFTWNAAGNAITLDAAAGGQQFAVGEGRLTQLDRGGSAGPAQSPSRVLKQVVQP